MTNSTSTGTATTAAAGISSNPAATSTASTGGCIASTTGSKPSTKIQINWPSTSTITKYIRTGLKLLGKLGAGAIILFALAHFVPELREEMPSFYSFIDFIIEAIEWIYSKLLAIFN